MANWPAKVWPCMVTRIMTGVTTFSCSLQRTSVPSSGNIFVLAARRPSPMRRKMLAAWERICCIMPRRSFSEKAAPGHGTAFGH